MILVSDQAQADLGGPELRCPNCPGQLRRWGFARTRSLRSFGGHQRGVISDARGPNRPRRTQEQELNNRKGWGLLVGHQRGLQLGH